MRHPTKIKSTLLFFCSALALTLAGCSGTMPDTLGVTEGKLAACPDKPNCVVSYQYDDTHLISALNYSGEYTVAYADLLKRIGEMPGSQIITRGERYVHAEFTSRLMRYVDDVEFYFNVEDKRIEVRSASRLGHSDMGVNRERIEALRALFKS